MPKNIEKCLNYNGKICKTQPIKYRSSWERIFCNFCDKEKSVVGWGYEIVEIPYMSSSDDSVHRYILDFVLVVKTKSGAYKKYGIEIKPDSQAPKLSETGDIEFPPAPKRKTNGNLVKWMAKNSVLQKNYDKWRYAEAWCKERGMIFKVITEKSLFG